MTQEQVNRGRNYLKRLSCKRKLEFNEEVVKEEMSIFFFGYKKPQDILYKCEECFRKEIQREDIDTFITYGESPYKIFLSKGNKESDFSNFCVECKTQLYIIRPKGTVTLDFE